MCNRPILFFLWCFLPTLAFSQIESIPNQIPSAAAKPHRHRHEEDAVAILFDALRKDAKLHPLSRIKDRVSLQQIACTVSVTNKVPLLAGEFPVIGNTPKVQDTRSALYKTVNPSEANPELQRIALFERPRGHGHPPGYATYSAAVWPTQKEITGKPEYWVGIELFWSAGTEFFLDHFTDEMEWKNEWKRVVEPECRDVR
jgi:hypothetical protein